MQHCWENLPEISSELKNRDRELWEDFLRIANGTKFFDRALQVVKFYTEQRHESIKNSLEAKLLRIIMNHLDENLEINIQEIWNYIISPENHILTGKLDGAQTFKLDEFAEKLSLHRIVALIKDKFFGVSLERRIRGEDGKYHEKTYYSFKEDVFMNLVNKYRIEIPSFDHPLYKGQKGHNGQNCDPSDPFDAHIRCYYDQLRK